MPRRKQMVVAWGKGSGNYQFLANDEGRVRVFNQGNLDPAFPLAEAQMDFLDDCEEAMYYMDEMPGEPILLHKRVAEYDFMKSNSKRVRFAPVEKF